VLKCFDHPERKEQNCPYKFEDQFKGKPYDPERKQDQPDQGKQE
jgi:hypothetical protein